MIENIAWHTMGCLKMLVYDKHGLGKFPTDQGATSNQFTTPREHDMKEYVF